jgi:hypothetical protein
MKTQAAPAGVGAPNEGLTRNLDKKELGYE